MGHDDHHFLVKYYSLGYEVTKICKNNKPTPLYITDNKNTVHPAGNRAQAWVNRDESKSAWSYVAATHGVHTFPEFCSVVFVRFITKKCIQAWRHASLCMQ